MLGPDQDLSQFPPWIWPYIRTVELASSRIFAVGERAATEAIPREVLLGHFVGILQAVQLKLVALRLGPAGAELAKAAGQSIADELDDWCGTKPPRPPIPHRAAELGAYIATFAASSGNDRLRGELAGVVDQLSARATQGR